jgi:primosomal protein N' (replication factor Y)
MNEFNSFPAMIKHYADIAFPTAVRRLFTYAVPDDMSVKPGVRVWVPLRSETSIGMVVRVHSREPEFKTKPVLRVLDTEPVMSETMLDLTGWIHRFYYCSWGEAIQAALPVGLNFVSEKKLKVSQQVKGSLQPKELEMLQYIQAGDLTLKEAQKIWRDGPEAKLLKKLIKKGKVEVWQEPKQKVGFKMA